jgi:hypothetical protein
MVWRGMIGAVNYMNRRGPVWVILYNKMSWLVFKLPQGVSSFLTKALHLRRPTVVNFSVVRYGIIGML